MKYEMKVEHIANLIMISDVDNQVWKVWDEEEFTTRKLNNWMNKFNKQTNNQYKIIINL